MSSDRVCVIIPTYYRDESLRRAIESALGQTYENVSVTVVDDSGEEYARSIVEKYDVQYIAHEENRGGNPARNTGYEATCGEYIQFLDDDDELFDSKIAKQVDLLRSSPSVGVAYGGIVGRDGSKIYPSPDERGRSLELALQFYWPTTITSSLLISDEVFSEVYPLVNRTAADDIGMKIELAKRTNFDFVDEVLTKIGDSADSRSSGMDYIAERESIYEKYQQEYERFPDYVRKNALSDNYRSKAETLLRENAWSLSAIQAFLLAAIYRPEFDMKLFFSVLASVFGRPGLQFARRLYGLL